jgi:hypothetical protein
MRLEFKQEKKACVNGITVHLLTQQACSAIVITYVSGCCNRSTALSSFTAVFVNSANDVLFNNEL